MSERCSTCNGEKPICCDGDPLAEVHEMWCVDCCPYKAEHEVLKVPVPDTTQGMIDEIIRLRRVNEQLVNALKELRDWERSEYHSNSELNKRVDEAIAKAGL